MVDESLVAFPRVRAAELAGVTLRRLDYWRETDVVRPTWESRVSPQRRVRLYGFTDLMSLLVTVELRKRAVSLQHIRSFTHWLRAFGYESPLTELTFATQGKHAYWQHPDGGWEGDLAPGQGVIAEVLDLRPLRARILKAARRAADTVGKTTTRRGLRGSKPVIDGTRVPVDTVRRYLDRGYSADQIVEAFPILEEADVEAVRVSAA